MSIEKEAGFTLMEVLVAMTILTVAILGLAIGATSIVQGNHTSQNHTVATNLAQDQLEALKANSAASLAPGGPVTTTVNGVVFTRNWMVTPNSPVAGVSRIDVTVTWSDYANRSITISSAVRP